MDYLFDGVLLYHSGEGVITRLEASDDDSIILTPVLNRILILLVENQGQLVTRERFLEKVWDDYGRRTSSNTLTQYMSTLRKLFADHLEKDCVITVPKQGYMLSPDIVIELLDSSPKSSIGELQTSTEEKKLNTEKTNVIKKNRVKKPVIFLFLFLFLLTTFYFFILPQGKMKELYVSDIDGCPIYFIDKKSQTENSNTRAKLHMKLFDLHCVSGADFYFSYSNARINLPENTHSMLARCINNNESHGECITTRMSGE